MKKSIINLLKKIEESTGRDNEIGIVSLNSILSRSLKKGGYDTQNDSCGGSNTSCENRVCPNATNLSCLNHSCLI